MFQKFFETIEDINRTIGEGVLVFKTSQDANELFQRTEEIHSKVDIQLNSVHEFQTHLVKKMNEVKEPEKVVIRNFTKAVQVDLIPPAAPKPKVCDISLQTQPELTHSDCQTVSPVWEDCMVQTCPVPCENGCVQTDDAAMEDEYTETIQVAVYNTANQTIPLPTNTTQCQTMPPPASITSYSQTIPPVVLNSFNQTDPPPPPPPVYDCFTQSTPPPSPPPPIKFTNRAIQTIVFEKKRAQPKPPPQFAPWRPSGKPVAPPMSLLNTYLDTSTKKSNHKKPLSSTRSTIPRAATSPGGASSGSSSNTSGTSSRSSNASGSSRRSSNASSANTSGRGSNASSANTSRRGSNASSTSSRSSRGSQR